MESSGVAAQRISVGLQMLMSRAADTKSRPLRATVTSLMALPAKAAEAAEAAADCTRRRPRR